MTALGCIFLGGSFTQSNGVHVLFIPNNYTHAGIPGEGTKLAGASEVKSDEFSEIVAPQEGFIVEVSAKTSKASPALLNRLACESGVDDLDQSFAYYEVDPSINFYPDHFFGQDHTNFVGTCENLGSMVVSVRREYDAESTQYCYRAIVRSAKGGCRRVVVKEACIPRKQATPTIVEVIKRILPESASIRCLSHAKVDQKMTKQLKGLDGCLGNADKTYKIGALCVEAGQHTEEQVYGNRTSSPLFQTFLNNIAECVDLQGFAGFRAGLDVRGNHTGTQSYYTEQDGYQCMFHVVTMLPFTEKDEQQVQRKRHIGNNCVTIVYLAPDAPPFDPAQFVSNFQFVFVVCRRLTQADKPPSYRVVTVRKEDIEPYGPDFPATGDTFNAASVENGTFRRFVLAKAISAENATYACDRMFKILNRTRLRLLDDLVSSYQTDIPLIKHQATSSLSRIKSLLSSRKRRGFSLDTTIYGQEAQVWWVQVVFGSTSEHMAVVISNDLFVTVDNTHSTRNQFPASCVTGWHCNHQENLLTVIYGKDDNVLALECRNAANLGSIVRRLKSNNAGSPLPEIKLCRVDKGQNWGFETKQMVVVDVIDKGIAL